MPDREQIILNRKLEKVYLMLVALCPKLLDEIELKQLAEELKQIGNS